MKLPSGEYQRTSRIESIYTSMERENTYDKYNIG